VSQNQFSYKKVWTDNFQKSNWAVPVYPVLADLQFSAGLKLGDTVNRRYRSNPIFAKTLGSDGSYNVQNYAESNETFTISKQREASVRIVRPDILYTDLNTTESYGKQLANAIYQEIDGDTLDTCRSGAGQTIDDGSFGGTSGNGLSVSISNIANIPVLAMEKFMGANVVYNTNTTFGKLAYEDYGGMLSWVIPPSLWTVIQQYFMARMTPGGDQVQTNGFKGQFGNFNLFVSTNLSFTARLALGVNPTDGDTITIKGVTLTFKGTVDAGTTHGQVKICSDAAHTVTNLVAFLNAPTTTVADATNAGYNGFTAADTLTENGYTILKSDALHGLTATDGTTYVGIVMKGAGKQTLSNSLTSASNGFATATTAPLQIVHSIFMVAKNVSLAVRQDPEIYENQVSNAIARDYVMWTVYDNKVFKDQARAIIDLYVRADASSFATYSPVHA
jgi:hypothetical protein